MRSRRATMAILLGSVWELAGTAATARSERRDPRALNNDKKDIRIQTGSNCRKI